MSLLELNELLDNVDIAFYESGAYYDSDKEDWVEAQYSKLESEYQFSVWEA